MKPALADRKKWFQFRQNMIAWSEKRREDELAELTQAEERSVRILQKRYGYTKEQATYQLRRYYPKARLE